MDDTLPPKDSEQFYQWATDHRKARGAVRLLLDEYTKATVKALHAENNSDTEREAEALVEALTTVTRFLDPSGAITQGGDASAATHANTAKVKTYSSA